MSQCDMCANSGYHAGPSLVRTCLRTRPLYDHPQPNPPPDDKVKPTCMPTCSMSIGYIIVSILSYRIWRENRDRIVGWYDRIVYWDPMERVWVYSWGKTCEPSLMLTGAAFYHKVATYPSLYIKRVLWLPSFRSADRGCMFHIKPH